MSCISKTKDHSGNHFISCLNQKGNHDYGGGDTYVQAQLDYAKIDSLWQMNGKNYSQYFSIPDGGTVAILFIDTTTLAPSVNKCCNSKGGISETIQLERINSQLKNIEVMLKEAVAKDATWIFIAGILACEELHSVGLDHLDHLVIHGEYV